MNRRKLCSKMLLCFLCFYSIDASGYVDTTGKKKRKTYYTKGYTASRFEAGINGPVFFSTGISRIQYYPQGFLGYTDCKYAAAEISLTHKNMVPSPYYGLKMGYESAWGGLLAWAAEARLLSEFDRAQLVFTMKAGGSLGSAVNLFYGYNFFDNAANYFGISHHQVSFNVSISRAILREVKGGDRAKKSG